MTKIGGKWERGDKDGEGNNENLGVNWVAGGSKVKRVVRVRGDWGNSGWRRNITDAGWTEKQTRGDRATQPMDAKRLT